MTTTTPTHTSTLDRLRRIGACDPIYNWVAAQPDCTPAVLWATCPRGDWLLWLAARVGVDRHVVVAACCACARTALRYVTDPRELRPLSAIMIAEAWARGDPRVSIGHVQDASADASACATAAQASIAASYTILDAVDASIAASYASHAILDAVDASLAASFAAHACACGAHAAVQHEHADIVRAVIPWSQVAVAIAETESDL